MLSPFRMVCGNFILPEPASYVFFYAVFNLRKLLYIIQGSAAYMVSAVKAPEVGSIGGEWAVIGLARSGYSVPANYYEDYYARV